MKETKTLVRRQVGMKLNNTLDELAVETVENKRRFPPFPQPLLLRLHKTYEPKV